MTQQFMRGPNGNLLPLDEALAAQDRARWERLRSERALAVVKFIAWTLFFVAIVGALIKK